MRFPVGVAIVATLASSAAFAADATGPVSVKASFRDQRIPLLIVAHRACHSPAPLHNLPSSTPENSIAGIERCITLGVDMAEVDVRRTRDGFLILMHDETVDRTTNGQGKVSDLTLREIQALRLKENEGGPGELVTDARVPTLEEALAVSKRRILLNLDVQAGLYVETVEQVVRAGQQDGVVIKQVAGIGSPVLTDLPPYDSINFMPVLAGQDDLPIIAARQLQARRSPVALELPRMKEAVLPAVVDAVRKTGTRLWLNSLWEGFIASYGGDVDALRDPDAVWGRMFRNGISIIQTDEPEALLAFREKLRKR